MSGPPDPVSVEQPAGSQPAATSGRQRRRVRLFGGLVMVAAGFLAGLVLLIYPWLQWWDDNLFSAWLPLWNSGYLRGAVAGLGAVNLALSLSSMMRIRRR